ncbi:CRISPR-associated helicase Cas3 [Calditerrivibrio nitroreducens DSM 19672]|uniref:CRISPR-associated helicase Cas3 n=2 Tax=Calditerrivibrio nitroreducens TaxID=477976 RepID=E4TH22_CALNY|nr:CRISPR-associated helicase Cas3 [Calditerrivibrio nitroreducens DSM 19672]
MCGLIKEDEIEKCLAKSDKTTIETHNKSIYENLNILKERISINDDALLENLKKVIKYHDYGKANLKFQQKLEKRKSEEILFHHLISPLFYLISNSNSTLKDEDKINIYAIIRHHNRQLELIESLKLDFIDNSLRKALKAVFEDIKDLINIPKNDYDKYINAYLTALISSDYLKQKYFKNLVLTTGFLIRLDHAASGGLEVEEKPITEDRKELLKRALGITDFRPFQKKFGIERKQNYQAIVADTGMGKTGLSVLWSNRKKFYILPNRASVNAMYETLKHIYGENKVGLLHSTSLFNLLENYEDDMSVLKQFDQTRVLSKPVTVCTADQLFTAAFNMPGYEKIYATLSYSDVVIDEIQGFQPQQIIPMLKQIKETKELGTRYLIITATLPDIIAKRLNEYGFCVIDNDIDTVDNIKRHKIRIENKKIEDLSDEILQKFKTNKKILIVTNTVKKAQELYQSLLTNMLLTEKEKHRINILHSRFIWKDRQEKEKNVLDETKQDGDGVYINKDGCIWVCTQLVEASLDIDFDYLFTEAATADSLIQRMGRVWRHRKKDYKGDENIIIATDVEYKVYEKILVEKSVELIQEAIIENSNYLYSKNKREIVKILYSEEKLTEWGSKYLDEWKKFENAINSGWNFILEENAQKAFRDVMTIELIPSNFKDEVIDIYNSFKDFINQINSDANISDRGKKTQKRLEKLKKLKSIQEYKVPVPIYLVNPNVSSKKINCSKPIEWLDKDYAIGFLHENYEYNKVLGLTGKSLALEEDNIL